MGRIGLLERRWRRGEKKTYGAARGDGRTRGRAIPGGGTVLDGGIVPRGGGGG